MHFVLDADYILELAKEFHCKPFRMPMGSDKVEGLVDHRGNVMPIVDFRKLLDLPSFRQEVLEMADFIAQRERDHVSWLEELRHCATTGAPFTKSIDPCTCAFGKWYEGVKSNPTELERLTNKNATLTHLFEAFDAPHKNIHAIAENVLSLAHSGQLDEAQAVIDHAWNTELASMRDLFKQFFVGFSAVFKPTAIILSVHNQKIALLVDSIKSVMPLCTADFNALSDIISSDASAMGSDAALIDGFPYVRVRPERILTEISEELKTLAAA